MYRDEADGILDEGYIVRNGSEDGAQNFLVNTVRHKKMQERQKMREKRNKNAKCKARKPE